LKIIDDLFKSNKKWSTSKIWHHIGGIVTSWIVVKQALLGTLSYEILLVYIGAVVAPNTVSKIFYIVKGMKKDVDNTYDNNDNFR